MRLDAVPQVPVGIFVALIDSDAPVSAWRLLMAVYACGRMRQTTSVKLDTQVFELAGIRDQNTQARAIAALDRCKAMAFERQPGKRVVAHLVRVKPWKRKYGSLRRRA